ncbi:MarC family protein [Methanocella arvoryzae]|uniref:UPF0056 membrane protein n=1 Tax=Methanocella arvoryzae (strain DSM 22066 / NBRC 105507 / MRE50) TaxID=351160 RepID=Q0W501_METAR|nr:MarC family protein [Methanocella arvoryzae]CAJ36542.1 conserved integral membrane protein (MarC family) [Methanocella arvoryzae MRE50]
MNFELFVSAAISIFVMSDPFGNIPIFLSLTGGMNRPQRRRVITKASIAATVIIFIFAVVGQPAMNLLGISLNALSIAGGMLLLLIALDMLMSTGLHAKRTESTENTTHEDEEADSIAITPMATPLIVGPGVMAATVVFMNRAAGLMDQALVLSAVLIAMLGSWIVMVNSDLLYAILHRDGTRVLTKVMGIILAAIATEMMISGLLNAFPALAG